MKIMSVVGARPNFMKVAPIVAAIQQRTEGANNGAIRHLLVHTGQHYDHLMSGSFFGDLNLPVPDVHLAAESGSHAAQTADIMVKFEKVLLQERPDILIVVGDVNSTLACALVASKVQFGHRDRPIIAHVEAGLRSFDRTMPEELNRILTDQLSDLLFVTEESGLQNLAREGFPEARVHFVGNTMIDTLLAHKERAAASSILDGLQLRSGALSNGSGSKVAPYVLLTLHRPANVDDRDAFLNILHGIDDLSKEYRVIFPAHPRTQSRIRDFSLDKYFTPADGSSGSLDRVGLCMIDPLGYLDFLCLMMCARLVVTDSGGIQEETTCLGVPCVTVRNNTERPVTLTHGTNVLGGVQSENIRAAARSQLQKRFAYDAPPKWDGKAAVRILDILISGAGRQNTCASC
jgi:UDP-N-acetylglucosamine 2-epimerase (non-hydrolysing)